MLHIDSFKKLIALAFVLGCGSVSATSPVQSGGEYEQALNLTPNLENGKKAYYMCTVCHRPEGWGSKDGAYPQVAGQLATVTIKQLADIRARNRDNPTMRPFASIRLLGGVQAIADVAAYIEQLPMAPVNGVGPGNDLVYGETIYKKECDNCHGAQGEGDLLDHIPAIRGQHYRYLVRQFEWIRHGKRRNADPQMVKQIQRFTARDVMAVMDYASRIKPPAEKVATPGWQNPDYPKYARHPMPYTPHFQ
ncbi:MAG: c-type cytochrome, partial [Candidatus Sedimenticola sp. (ex Thyasira tokunagai)]